MKFGTDWIVTALAFALVGVVPVASAHAQSTASQQAPPPEAMDEPQGPGLWMVRLRGYDFVPGNHSAPFTFLGGNFGPHALTVSTKVGFEGDVTYFLRRNIAVEFAMSTPMQNSVNIVGGGPIGSFNQIPTSLNLQYHYQIPKIPVKPYIGLGLDYTHVTSESLFAGGNQLAMTRSAMGVDYQIGVDIAMAQGFYLNLDFRHMQLSPNLRSVSTGSYLTDANMCPNLFAVGVGYRF